MNIREHDCVVPTADLPEDGLLKGDVGTLVHIHDNGTGYEVEFMTLGGETVAVTTVMPSQLRRWANVTSPMSANWPQPEPVFPQFYLLQLKDPASGCALRCGCKFCSFCPTSGFRMIQIQRGEELAARPVGHESRE